MGSWWSRSSWWSDPVRLKDYEFAPKGHGVYEIGFYRDGGFVAKYLGRAVGKGVTIQSRLKSHYSKAGNKNVRDYLDGVVRDNLYCR